MRSSARAARGVGWHRFVALLRADLRQQYRQKFYAAYAVVVIAYLLLLRALPPEPRTIIAPMIIYSDPAVLGFFFLGGLMLLERGDGVRDALHVTPISARDYLLAKTFSLTGLALLATAAIGFLGALETVHWAELLGGTALVSALFIGVGAPFALRAEKVSSYLIGSILYLTPILAPIVAAYFDTAPFWRLYPPLGGFDLIRAGLGAPVAHDALWFAWGGGASGAVAAQLWAIRALAREPDQ